MTENENNRLNETEQKYYEEFLETAKNARPDGSISSEQNKLLVYLARQRTKAENGLNNAVVFTAMSFTEQIYFVLAAAIVVKDNTTQLLKAASEPDKLAKNYLEGLQEIEAFYMQIEKQASFMKEAIETVKYLVHTLQIIRKDK